MEVFLYGLGRREKGKQIYISLTGNPLFPHPLSLTIKTFLGEAEYENKTAFGGGFSLWFREEGKGKRGNKFISLLREIPSSLVPNDEAYFTAINIQDVTLDTTELPPFAF